MYGTRIYKLQADTWTGRGNDSRGLLKLGHLPQELSQIGGRLDATETAAGPGHRETLLPRAFLPPGFIDLSFSRWATWQEMTDSGW
jgi:hypothetical protein